MIVRPHVPTVRVAGGTLAAAAVAWLLPALAPLSVLYAGEGPGRTARATGLASGYLLTWAAFGVLALLISAAAARLATRNESAGEWVGAAVLIAAGAYQLSPLKERCLALCRSPLHILMRVGAFRGPVRHLRAGVYHGGYCIGCCWSLMVALIALGVMDLRWMVVVLGLLAPWRPGIVPGLRRR